MTSDIVGAKDALDQMYKTGLPGDRWSIMTAVAEAVQDTGWRTSDQLVELYTDYCAREITTLIERLPLPPILGWTRTQLHWLAMASLILKRPNGWAVNF